MTQNSDRRCLACVMPASTPGITFDDHGVCSQCRSYRPIRYYGEPALRSILDRFRGTGRTYDCIVTVSGGRDSTYTLLKTARDYQLRVLAVSYDNPYADSVARRNVEQATRVLQVDLIRFRLPGATHARSLRRTLHTWLRRPSPALVPIICSACHTMWWHIYRLARRHGVRCVVSGGNFLEHTSFKRELLGVSAGEDVRRVYDRNLGGIVREVLRSPGYLDPGCLPTLLLGHVFGSPYALGPRILARDFVWIDLFFFLPWRETEVISRITADVNWDYPHHLGSTWRFDCRVGHLKDLMYRRTAGVTEREDFYSKMVREGMTTRAQALSRLARENVVHWDEVQSLLDELRVPPTALLARPAGS